MAMIEVRSPYILLSSALAGSVFEALLGHAITLRGSYASLRTHQYRNRRPDHVSPTDHSQLRA